MRRLLVSVVALLVVVLASLPRPAAAAGIIRHVSVGGSDAAAGTAAAPYRTLTHALRALTPGDTLVVHGGTYDERVKNPPIRRASLEAPIRVVAAPGEEPVLRGLLWLSDADHWMLEGLRVTWSDANVSSEHMVKMTGGNGWRITRSTFWGARSYAALLIAGQPRSFTVDHNVIRDTRPTNGLNQDHLIYFNGGSGGGVIEHNVLANSPNGRGIKVGPSVAGTTPIGNLVIRNNTFFNNTGPSNIQLSYGATGNLIERNVLQRPQPGKPSITAYELNGGGNVARDNVAWETGRVVEHDPGLIDSGNHIADPRLVNPAAGDFRVGDPALRAYGAGGIGPGLTAPIPRSDAGPTAPTPRSIDSGPTAPTLRRGAGDRGYRMMASDGGIFTFGDAAFHGSTGGLRLNRSIVGGASTRTGDGYWLVASDGGVFTFGGAGFHGSTGHLRLNQPIVAMAATPGGHGYWLVARDGGIFTFGDAGFHGSAAGHTSSVVAIAATATGGGYWISTSDGRVFAFGDAADLGGVRDLNHPVVGMTPTPTGRGYWLVARDGGIFTFGDAAFHGSTGDLRLNQPVVGLGATTGGYRLVAADGGVFSFGDAGFLGSTGAIRLNSPIIAFL